MVKRKKRQKDKQRSTKRPHKTKDQATRNPLKGLPIKNLSAIKNISQPNTHLI